MYLCYNTYKQMTAQEIEAHDQLIARNSSRIKKYAKSFSKVLLVCWPFSATVSHGGGLSPSSGSLGSKQIKFLLIGLVIGGIFQIIAVKYLSYAKRKPEILANDPRIIRIIKRLRGGEIVTGVALISFIAEAGSIIGAVVGGLAFLVDIATKHQDTVLPYFEWSTPVQIYQTAQLRHLGKLCDTAVGLACGKEFDYMAEVLKNENISYKEREAIVKNFIKNNLLDTPQKKIIFVLCLVRLLIWL